MRVEHPIFLMRLHRRHRFLPAIFSQIVQMTRRRMGTVIFGLDRPTPAVVRAVDKAVRSAPTRLEFDYVTLPPLQSSEGAAWVDSLQLLHSRMLQIPCADAGMLLDDDILFTDNALRELEDHLADLQLDRVDAQKLHVCDDSFEHHDEGIHETYETFLFRVYREDKWTQMNNCPDRVARSPLRTRLDNPVLHFGYINADERERCWNAAKLCGQTDAYYRSLAMPPQPVPITHSCSWLEKILER